MQILIMGFRYKRSHDLMFHFIIELTLQKIYFPAKIDHQTHEKKSNLVRMIQFQNSNEV